MEYSFSDVLTGNASVSERTPHPSGEEGIYGTKEILDSYGVDIKLYLSVDDDDEELYLSLSSFHIKCLDEDRHFHTSLDVKLSMTEISKLRRLLEFFEKEMAANGGKL